VRIEEGPVPGELGDVVLLHQEVHTANPAVGDLPAAPERRRMVEPGAAAWSNRMVEPDGAIDVDAKGFASL
jgi:hypothetical protein